MSSTAASLVRERETSTGTVELSVCDAGQRVLLTAPRKRATVVSLFGGQGFGKSTVGNGLAAALAESQGTTQPLHLSTGNGLSHTTRGVDVALAAGRVLLDVEGHGDVSDTQVHDLRMQNIVAASRAVQRAQEVGDVQSIITGAYAGFTQLQIDAEVTNTRPDLENGLVVRMEQQVLYR